VQYVIRAVFYVLASLAQIRISISLLVLFYSVSYSIVVTVWKGNKSSVSIIITIAAVIISFIIIYHIIMG